MQYTQNDLHFLLHSADLVEERLRQRLAVLGIRPRQARIIDALNRMGKSSQAELARIFDVTPASMSTMTARLLDAGYIVRSPHPDEARSNVLELSNKGRGLLGEVFQAWSYVDAMIKDTIGAENAEQLAKLTQQLRDALGGHSPGDETMRTGTEPGDNSQTADTVN